MASGLLEMGGELLFANMQVAHGHSISDKVSIDGSLIPVSEDGLGM